MFKKRLYSQLQEYIDRHLIPSPETSPKACVPDDKKSEPAPVSLTQPKKKAPLSQASETFSPSAVSRSKRPDAGFGQAAREALPLFDENDTFPGDSALSHRLRDIDESFSECLVRLIDEKGMTDAQCYKKALVDRKLFSKIRSNRLYQPSKSTAVSFALALELDLKDTQDFLSKAGFTLSHSSKADIIIEYFILHRQYRITDINEALYEFDQPLL